MKRIITALLGIYEKMVNCVKLRYRKVKYHHSLVINGVIKLYGHGEILIGENVRINSKESANPGLGAYPRTVFSVPTGRLVIGNNVGMSNVAITCAECVEIGNNVLLGAGVKIYDTDFHSLNCEIRGRGRDIDIPEIKRVKICENAFIGAHSIILKGVTVGVGAVIGAGSVVTKDVPDGEIWAGNPARKIR